MSLVKIAFGGGCHWCTEAVFQSLRGVHTVEQGFVKSQAPNDSFSEAVVVTFAPDIIPLEILVSVHLRTHSSTSRHKMRGKYRSAVYVFSDAQADCVERYLKAEQSEFDDPIVTMVLSFREFKPSLEQFQGYYEANKGKPFCNTYIDPKLRTIRRLFGPYASTSPGDI